MFPYNICIDENRFEPCRPPYSFFEKISLFLNYCLQHLLVKVGVVWNEINTIRTNSVIDVGICLSSSTSEDVVITE